MRVQKCLVWLAIILGSVFPIAGPGIAQNAVPMLMNYQGELRSPTTGEPVPDGEYKHGVQDLRRSVRRNATLAEQP